MKKFIQFILTMIAIVGTMAILTNAVQADSHLSDEKAKPTWLVTIFFDDYGVSYIKQGVEPWASKNQDTCFEGGDFVLNYWTNFDDTLRFVILCVELRDDWTMEMLIADIASEFSSSFPPKAIPVPKEPVEPEDDEGGYGLDPAIHFHDESDA